MLTKLRDLKELTEAYNQVTPTVFNITLGETFGSFSDHCISQQLDIFRLDAVTYSSIGLYYEAKGVREVSAQTTKSVFVLTELMCRQWTLLKSITECIDSILSMLTETAAICSDPTFGPNL